jgi:hypothetical protein
MFTNIVTEQAALSVELTLFYGYFVAQLGIVDTKTASKVSSLCTRGRLGVGVPQVGTNSLAQSSTVFLPALIIVQCGPELDVAS